MRKIYTKNEYSEACRVASQVYDGQTSKDDAVSKLVSAGINETSANDFIVIYKSLVEGKSFLRGASSAAMKYFICLIKDKYGIDGLRRAVSALDDHITRQKSPMHQMKVILADFEKELNELNSKPNFR